jgi:release factor glutamine methyltransferase
VASAGVQTQMTNSSTAQTWTILSLINWATEYLREKNFENPRLNVELLLSHSLQCSRVQLYTSFEKPLSKDELANFKQLFQRRLQHEPLQYIIGETEFFGLKFLVDKRVLIPRPETEILVEEVINHCKTFSQNETINILDIGTGSGNIPVTLAKHISNANIFSIDISNDALELAKENAKRNEVENKIEFLIDDIFILQSKIKNLKFDIIVSNPPYISIEEFETLQPEIKNYEPIIATTDNADGLSFYKRISELGKELLKVNGMVAVEIAYNQSELVKSIFAKANFKNITSRKDYNGIERVMLCEYQ